ncbi:hypothetical protein DER46DRAFT_626243 [Fusarium sp. MPI-SDFR-AT-0072]|nr:hypothetical protein DER46DRAFT_626243 [Fusarium sp. MPI-SDFR-AT-0072]
MLLFCAVSVFIHLHVSCNTFSLIRLCTRNGEFKGPGSTAQTITGSTQGHGPVLLGNSFIFQLNEGLANKSEAPGHTGQIYDHRVDENGSWVGDDQRIPAVKLKIEQDLLLAEELLRDLLLGCRQQLATPDLEIWITGGWEVYDDDCRTPEMEFGTAEEDAFRRDATANALFFDLQNRKVADFTRRGLDDLYAGIMRTPLEPRQTFLDDPLRVLRLIRIGSKLGFTLDPEALSCIKEHEIHVALDEKVSQERVEIEANLYGTVFQSLRSPLHEPERPWPATWSWAINAITTLTQNQARDFGALMESEKQKDMLWAMVAYAPLAGLDTKDHKLAVDEAINALKGTRQLYKLIESSLGNLESIRSTIELVVSSTPSRGPIGMRIREWVVFWGLYVRFSALGEIVYLKPQPESPDPKTEAGFGFVNKANLGWKRQKKRLLGSSKKGNSLPGRLKACLNGNLIMRRQTKQRLRHGFLARGIN